jgi:hypothetical protein
VLLLSATRCSADAAATPRQRWRRPPHPPSARPAFVRRRSSLTHDERPAKRGMPARVRPPLAAVVLTVGAERKPAMLRSRSCLVAAGGAGRRLPLQASNESKQERRHESLRSQPNPRSAIYCSAPLRALLEPFRNLVQASDAEAPSRRFLRYPRDRVRRRGHAFACGRACARAATHRRDPTRDPRLPPTLVWTLLRRRIVGWVCVVVVGVIVIRALQGFACVSDAFFERPAPVEDPGPPAPSPPWTGPPHGMLPDHPSLPPLSCETIGRGHEGQRAGLLRLLAPCGAAS